MKRDSRGITIIELMLGTVLLSIVALSVTFFISTGTKACNHAEDTIRLQEESQVLSNQLVNISIEGNSISVEMDANGDVRYYVFKTNSQTGVTGNECIIYFKKSSQEVYYYEVDSTTASEEIASINAEVSGTRDEILVGELMGEFVTSFDVIPQNEKTVSFEIGYSLNDKTLSSKDTVSLRNRYVEVTTPII